MPNKAPSMAVPMMLSAAAGAVVASGMIAAAQGIGHGIWQARENAILNRNAENNAKMRSVLVELNTQIVTLFDRLVANMSGYLDVTKKASEHALVDFIMARDEAYEAASNGFDLIKLLRALALGMVAKIDELAEMADEEVNMVLELDLEDEVA